MIRQFLDQQSAASEEDDGVPVNDKSIAPLIGKALPIDAPSSAAGSASTGKHLTRKERIEQNKHAPVWKQEVCRQTLRLFFAIINS